MQRILGIVFYFKANRQFREFLLREEKGFHSLPKGDLYPDETPESAFKRIAHQFFARSFGRSDKRHIVGSFEYSFGGEKKEVIIFVQEVPRPFFAPYGYGYVQPLWTSRPASIRMDLFSQAVFAYENVLPYLSPISDAPLRP